MFKRNVRCRCGKKISRDYLFCPFCGSRLKEGKEPDNILDSIQDIESQMPFMFRFPFKKLVREIEQQLVQMDKEMGKEMQNEKSEKISARPENFAQGISISINSTNGVPVIKMKQFGPDGMKEMTNKDDKKEEQKIKTLTKADQEKLEKYSKLPKEEPRTTVRRLSDRIIYEIALPGIKNKQNIVINRLENSIEIKAFAKDKAYFKLIPLNLPIKKHYLENEKLVLELKP
jgi:hypothetical protein